MEMRRFSPLTFITSSFFIGILFFTTPKLCFGQTNPVAGTFRFEAKTDKVLFLRNDVIESLYPEIEAKRANRKDIVWDYNSDLRIIIFSKETIESPFFTPLASPYDYMKQL